MITSLYTYGLNIPIRGYLRRTLNYPERIALFDPTHMISMVDLITIGIETLRIDGGRSLEKECI